MTMLRYPIALALLFGAAFATSGAQASTITVDNPSFETLGAPLSNTIGCGGGNPTCAYNDGPIPGWTASGGQTGAQNLGILLTPEDGNVAAYANGDGTTLSQIVSATSIAGDTYTLTVFVGDRTDGFNGPVTVSLDIGGVLTDATGSMPGPGTWSAWTASYLATTSGAPISIDLISDGLQGNFDNVSLTATPLPATWSMLLIGFFGLGLVAYRASRARALTTATAW
jgi:hypothetical protein